MARPGASLLRTFELAVLEGRILVAWIMYAGNACEGSEVLRSINEVDLTTVHRIDGI